MKSDGDGHPCEDVSHVLEQKYGFTKDDLEAQRNGTCVKRKHTECFKREYLAPKVIRNSISYKNIIITSVIIKLLKIFFVKICLSPNPFPLFRNNVER